MEDDAPYLVPAPRIIEPSPDSGGSGRPPFKVHTFSDLAQRQVADRRFLIKGLIPDRCVTGLWGRGSVGKTMLCLQMGEAIATGADFMGLEVSQGRVLLMLNEDDTDEVARRVQRLKAVSGNAWVVDYADVADPCLMRFEPNGTPVLTPALARLETTIADLAPGVVFLDPLSLLFGGNENARLEVATFVRRLSTLCERQAMAIVMVGHPAKAQDSEYSGSGAWETTVRSRLLLKKDDNGADDEYRLLRPKSNYAPADDEGLPLIKGVSGEFLDASLFDRAGEKRRAEQGRRDQANTLARRFISEQHRNGGQMPTRSTSGNSSLHGLMGAICPERLGDFTAKELADAVTRLADRGELVEETYKDASRHRKTRLVPAGVAK